MTKAALDDRHAVIGRHVARSSKSDRCWWPVKSASRRTLETLFATQSCALDAAILCPSRVSSSDCVVNL
jgi:hypothetical protein